MIKLIIFLVLLIVMQTFFGNSVSFLIDNLFLGANYLFSPFEIFFDFINSILTNMFSMYYINLLINIFLFIIVFFITIRFFVDKVVSNNSNNSKNTNKKEKSKSKKSENDSK